MRRPRPTFDRQRMVNDMCERGWTAEELARICQRHPSTLSNFFQERTHSPKLAAAIAHALGYSLRRYLVRVA